MKISTARPCVSDQKVAIIKGKEMARQRLESLREFHSSMKNVWLRSIALGLTISKYQIYFFYILEVSFIYFHLGRRYFHVVSSQAYKMLVNCRPISFYRQRKNAV